MEAVYELWFEREYDNREPTELKIGIYSTEAAAKAAIEEVKNTEGFSDFPAGFQIYETKLGITGWREGFVTEWHGVDISVTEAVQSRRSVRAFTDQPVDRETLTRVLEKAQRSPSGGNTQPWHGVVLTGEPMQALFDRIAQEFPKGREAHKPEYHIYPPELDGAYEQRRFGVGEDLYGALEISREEKGKRLMWFAENFRAFGAPVLMLVHTPKYMGPPQWSDIGMWLQTIALLLREEGLDSCFQEAWAVYSPQIREMVDIPEDHIFFCGMAIGYRDPDAAVNNFDVKRAGLDEAVRFEGWG